MCRIEHRGERALLQAAGAKVGARAIFLQGIDMRARTTMWACLSAALSGAIVLAGCETTGGTVAAVAAATSAYAARSPSSELYQIYYLGIFDPTGQLPEAFYRVTVRGQASALSGVDFQSGWVPAVFVDSLGAQLQLQPAGASNGGPPPLAEVTRSPAPAGQEAAFKVGRRLVLFGPEGFREAPKNHRLVILMGADASKFFNAVDTALGTVAGVEVARNNDELRATLFQALAALAEDRRRVAELEVAAERLTSSIGTKP